MPNEDNIIDSVLNTTTTAPDTFDPTTFVNNEEPQTLEEGEVLVSVTLSDGTIKEIVVNEDLTYRDSNIGFILETSLEYEDMRSLISKHNICYIDGEWHPVSTNNGYNGAIHCDHNDTWIYRDDSIFGIYNNSGDEGYWHVDEEYVRSEGDDSYISSEVANDHNVYYYDCCDSYVHEDDHNCSSDEDYFDNTRNKSKHDTLNDSKYWGTNSPTYSISNGMRYTFGVEIETSCGTMDYDDWQDLNIKAVYDGSTSGPEYVTGVLKGDYGFNHLKKICESVKNNGHETNRRCGIHVHVGGKFNRLFTIMLLRLGHKIQDELYRMMPPSRLGNTYCKYIPDYVMHMNLTNWREHLGKYIHGSGCTLDKHSNKKSRLGSYPSTRYRWINCVNFSSNTNIPTVEFRNHGASMSYDKIRNWTLICMAIVRYAENNQKRIWYNIEDINLNEVIMTSLGDNIGKQIMTYYYKRSKLFVDNYAEDGSHYDDLPSGYERRGLTID